MRDLIEELKDATRPGLKKLIADAEAAGFTVKEKDGTTHIFKKHGGWGKPSVGITIYPDGAAVDMTVALDVQKVIRTFKTMRKVLGI